MIVLKGITWKNPRGYDPLVAASARYNALFPDIQVQWEQYPWYEFEQRILDDFNQKKRIYDLIMFDHPWTGTLAANGWLLPWDDYLPESYTRELKQRVVAPSVESYYYNDKQWALPLDAASHCALYQKHPGLRGELPATWEMIGAWAIEQQKAGFETPLVLSLQGVLGSCLFLSMMASYGQPAFADPEAANINIEAAKYVLTLLKELQAYSPPGSSNWGPWDIYDRFCENQDLLYSPSIFGYVNYLGPNNAGKNLYVSTIPSFQHRDKPSAIIGGVGLGLTYSCNHVDAALAYGRFLMSDQVQKEVFPVHFGQPSVKDVWEDTALNLAVNNFYLDLRPNMDNGYIRPRYNGFHSVELAIGDTLQKWWDDETDLETTIVKLSEIKPTLKH